MEAYSTDLRRRVAEACDEGGATREQIAARFKVSARWIRKLLERRRETGSIEPRPHGGGRAPAFDAEAAGRLRQAVREAPDATLEDLAATAGVACGAPATCRALKRLGITRKKSRGGRPSRTGPS
jgi:transposase